MQTFLPYSDFIQSARCLDTQRLGKQRVEALTILRVLYGDVNGWENHPAVRMWEGYEDLLLAYITAVCKEWVGRGYKDNVLEEAWAEYGVDTCVWNTPWWLGGHIHSNHRSWLLGKDIEWYSQYNWPEVPIDRGVYWPTHEVYNGKSA